MWFFYLFSATEMNARITAVYYDIFKNQSALEILNGNSTLEEKTNNILNIYTNENFPMCWPQMEKCIRYLWFYLHNTGIKEPEMKSFIQTILTGTNYSGPTDFKSTYLPIWRIYRWGKSKMDYFMDKVERTIRKAVINYSNKQ